MEEEANSKCRTLTLVGVAGDAGSSDGAGHGYSYEFARLSTGPARLSNPRGVSFHSSLNYALVADGLNTIRKVVFQAHVLAVLSVTTIAGSAGSPGSADGSGSVDGGLRQRGVGVDLSQTG